MEKEHNNNPHTNTGIIYEAMRFLLKITAVTVFLLLPAISQSAVGGGNGPIFDSPDIFNEKVIYYVNSGATVISWETDNPATSRVIYGTKSQKKLFAFDANNIDHGYDFSTNQDNTLTTKHKIIIQGLAPNTQYFFRSESRVNNYARLGEEITSSDYIANSPRPSDNTTACNYINGYLKIGKSNNSAEILKLQTFLRDFEGFTNVKTTSVFDQATFDAVSAFQKRYANEILAPWGITSPTGFVYITTQKKINEIHCGKTLALTKNQLDEINRIRSSLKLEIKSKNNSQRKNINIQTSTNKDNSTNADNSYSDNEGNKQASMQASVANTKTGVVRSIFNKFINLFR